MNQKSIARELVLFSLPLILSGILQQLYSWADAFILGHSGPQGEMMLGAVGATGSITILLVNSILGLTLGLSILWAQEYGRQNAGKIRSLLANFLPVLGGVYALLALLAVCFLKPILQLMDTPAEIFTYSMDYLRIVLPGVPFLAVYNLYAALLRAVGNTKAAFYSVLISSGLNVVLDILLVLVFPFGVAGAAAATLISQIAMTAFMVLYSRIKYPQYTKLPKGLQFDSGIFREGLRFALPPAVQNSITSIGNLVLQNFMNNFGASTVLAITTAYRVDSIMLLPVINLGSAVSSMVARAKGTGDRCRIRKCLNAGLALMVALSGGLALVMFFFGASFVGFFGVTGEALAIGKLFFRELSIFYVLFGISMVLRSTLEGIGDITYCSIIGVVSLAIRIGASYWLRPAIGNRAIAIAEGISWCLLLAMITGRFLQKRKEIQ